MKLCRAVLFSVLFLFAFSPAAAQLSATVALSEPLEEWKHQIEELGNGRVILARVFTDRQRNELILPQDAEQRPVLRQFFLNENFVAQFVASHAMNLNYSDAEGKFHFILLNMARAPEWGDAEDAVLAHEFGHVWLSALSYPMPVYEPGPEACVNILAGDIVQHILIREEIRRRSIPYLPYWVSNLEEALAHLQKQDTAPEREATLCQRLARLVMWVDVRLGLSEEAWHSYTRFEKTMERSYPGLKPDVDWFTGFLRDADVRDRDVHLRALTETLKRLYALADSLRAGGPGQP